jgi:hypothetical protein
MNLIKIAEGVYVASNAFGSIESKCDEEVLGATIFRTTIRSQTGGVLFERIDKITTHDKASVQSRKLAHENYLNAVLKGCEIDSSDPRVK